LDRSPEQAFGLVPQRVNLIYTTADYIIKSLINLIINQKKPPGRVLGFSGDAFNLSMSVSGDTFNFYLIIKLVPL
jgi:hypothetical protein